MSDTLLLDFFKTMNNEYRLQMAGLLMAGKRTVNELATLLNLKPADVLDHLAALRLLDMVTVDQAEQATYRFNKKALYKLSHTVLHTAKVTPVDDWTEVKEREVLRNFFDGNRLKIIPESPVKFAMLIRWLVTRFEQDKRYTEREVNDILSQYHEDFATMRRGLIDAGLMQRERGIYWRL